MKKEIKTTLLLKPKRILKRVLLTEKCIDTLKRWIKEKKECYKWLRGDY